MKDQIKKLTFAILRFTFLFAAVAAATFTGNWIWQDIEGERREKAREEVARDKRNEEFMRKHYPEMYQELDAFENDYEEMLEQLYESY